MDERRATAIGREKRRRQGFEVVRPICWHKRFEATKREPIVQVLFSLSPSPAVFRDSNCFSVAECLLLVEVDHFFGTILSDSSVAREGFLFRELVVLVVAIFVIVPTPIYQILGGRMSLLLVCWRCRRGH